MPDLAASSEHYRLHWSLFSIQVLEMIETLVLAVGFFCGNAPLRTIEHIAAPGMVSTLPVPVGCPQPRELLWLELRCERELCRGQITQGHEAGHSHAALASIDGPPGDLRVRFTNVEGRLLSMLRLSVTARRPLTVAEEKTLAPVTLRSTAIQLRMGSGSAAFTGNTSGVVGSVGPKGRALQVRLQIEDAKRTVDLLGPDGELILRVSEGASATVACTKAGGICQGQLEVSAEAEPVLRLTTP